jgi:hypothetical protein
VPCRGGPAKQVWAGHQIRAATAPTARVNEGIMPDSSQRDFALAALGRELTEFFEREGASLRKRDDSTEDTVRATTTFTLRFTDPDPGETDLKPRLCCLCLMSWEGEPLCHGDCR